MIKINGNDIVGIYYTQIPIVAVYMNGQLMWSGRADVIYSCYARGYWVDDDPWTDDTPWTD